MPPAHPPESLVYTKKFVWPPSSHRPFHPLLHHVLNSAFLCVLGAQIRGLSILTRLEGLHSGPFAAPCPDTIPPCPKTDWPSRPRLPRVCAPSRHMTTASGCRGITQISRASLSGGKFWMACAGACAAPSPVVAQGCRCCPAAPAKGKLCPRTPRPIQVLQYLTSLPSMQHPEHGNTSARLLHAEQLPVSAIAEGAILHPTVKRLLFQALITPPKSTSSADFFPRACRRCHSKCCTSLLSPLLGFSERLQVLQSPESPALVKEARPQVMKM